MKNARLKKENFDFKFISQGVYQLKFTSPTTYKVHTVETEDYFTICKVMGVKKPKYYDMEEVKALALGNHTKHYLKYVQPRLDAKYGRPNDIKPKHNK
jgi:hypothetical protein